MEKFKKVIKRRIYLLAIPALVGIGLLAYNFLGTDTEIKSSYVYGFQLGVGITLGVMAIINMVRFGGILRDEKKLQLQYNKENDERYLAIRGKAGLPMMLFTSVGMLIAAIIASYFDFTVFFTLMVAAYCQMLVAGLLKAYYMKTM